MKLSSFRFASVLAAVALLVGAVQAQTLSITTLAGSAGEIGNSDGSGTLARFIGPYGLAIDPAGNLYVADHGNQAVRRISPSGVVSTLAGHFLAPYGVALDSAGNLYVSDTLNFVVDKIGPDGTLAVFAGISGQRGTSDGAAGVGSLSGPTGIAVDAAGDVYVADTNRGSAGGVVRKVAPDGTLTTVVSGLTDPRGVVLDADGNLFIADAGDNTIRCLGSGGELSLFAGIANRTGADDGGLGTARFNQPSALAIDGSNNLYVADYGNSTVREISPAGVVTTVAGLAVVEGSADGVGSNARFYTPAGIAATRRGTVYVADTGNDTVRLGLPTGTGSGLAAEAAAPASAPAGSVPAHLVNLSIRAEVGGSAGNLVVGFATAGAAPKAVLVRAVGPALAEFGVAGVLRGPRSHTLYRFERGDRQRRRLGREPDLGRGHHASRRISPALGFGRLGGPAIATEWQLLRSDFRQQRNPRGRAG